jgi:hypothetical protein
MYKQATNALSFLTAPHTDNTSPVLWVRTHPITPQTLNNFNFHYFITSHFYPILFYIIIQK